MINIIEGLKTVHTVKCPAILNVPAHRLGPIIMMDNVHIVKQVNKQDNRVLLFVLIV